MALSDPELELLQELLQDDPGADVWMQVGEELLRRGEWQQAEDVLSGGLGIHTDALEAWPLLARASLELGHIGLALVALDNVPFDPASAPEAARVRILAMERSGQKEECRKAVELFLRVDPSDVVVTSVLERLEGKQEETAADVIPGRVPDPLISMDRAERYIAVGRPDRAARVFRRILFHNPEFAAASTALKALGRDGLGRQMTEDLSEELLHPASAPPSLDMPPPKLDSLVADEEVTEPRELSEAIKAYARGEGKNPLPSSFDENPDEMTDPFANVSDLGDKLSKKAKAPRRRRRRRSLLNR